MIRKALVIGGARQGRADIDAALSLAEFDGVVACNDVGMTWAGKLDAWVSLHPDKFVQWTEGRRANGHKRADRHFACTSVKTGPTYTTKTPSMFNGQTHSGSSGLFAVKVALIDLGFDKAVCCGIPMDRESAHYFTPHTQWEGAVSHRKGWMQAMDHIRDRVRSMSGWTAKELGMPDPAWLDVKE